MNRDFKGIWIPREVWMSKDLTLIEKIFYVEISSLDVDKTGCWAANSYFADFFGLSKGRCSQIISSLEKKALVLVRLKRKGKQVVERRIFTDPDIVAGARTLSSKTKHPCLENDSTLSSKTKHPCLENDKENNTNSSNTENNTTTKTSCPVQKNRTVDEDKKRKNHGTPEDHVLALKMYEAILVVNATVKEPNWDQWANHIRLMREQDGRDHVQIWRVFDFANRDQFWCNNILSPGALRRHYSKLAPKSGAVRSGSGVRGVGADVVDHGSGYTCGQCMFAGKGKWACGGHDADPDHKACEDLFRLAEVVA